MLHASLGAEDISLRCAEYRRGAYTTDVSRTDRLNEHILFPRSDDIHGVQGKYYYDYTNRLQIPVVLGSIRTRGEVCDTLVLGIKRIAFSSDSSIAPLTRTSHVEIGQQAIDCSLNILASM